MCVYQSDSRKEVNQIINLTNKLGQAGSGLFTGAAKAVIPYSQIKGTGNYRNCRKFSRRHSRKNRYKFKQNNRNQELTFKEKSDLNRYCDNVTKDMSTPTKTLFTAIGVFLAL